MLSGRARRCPGNSAAAILAVRAPAPGGQ